MVLHISNRISYIALQTEREICGGERKMIRNQREEDVPTKQEVDDDSSKAPTMSSRLWSGLNNPRIVRVSRAFGGKDRHSKVSTVRGLRDRRVRLSVPTAIQLYDLQDRLGVNQPSKVVDWLLNAAHQEIDKLPPLQFPPGSLVQIPHSLPPLAVENIEYVNRQEPRLNKAHINEGTSTFPQSTYWNPKRQDDPVNSSGVDDLPRILGHSLVSMPAPDTYHHWDATNAYLSQFGIRPMQIDALPATFPSYFSSSSADFDAKQFIQMQTVNLASAQTSQSNSGKNSLHLGGPSIRPFQ